MKSKIYKSLSRALVVVLISSNLVMNPTIVSASTKSEENANIKVNQAMKDSNFYSFNMAYQEVMKVEDEITRNRFLSQLASIQSKVWNSRITYYLDKFKQIATDGLAKVYDTTLVELSAETELKPVEIQYLLGELNSWGKEKIYTKDYISATDSIIAIWTWINEANRTGSYKTLLDDANLKINAITNYNNRSYLLAQLEEAQKAYDKLGLTISNSSGFGGSWGGSSGGSNSPSKTDEWYLQSGGIINKDLSISKYVSTLGNSNNITTVNGDVTINIDSATSSDTIKLQNIIMNGTLIINFGAGTVDLNNIIADEVRVNNVGESSLHINEGTTIKLLTVVDINDDAHVVVNDNAFVTASVLSSGASIDGIIPTLSVIGTTTSSAIQLSGNFTNVDVDSLANITLGNTTVINKLNLNNSTTLVLPKGASVESLTIAPSNTSDIYNITGDLKNVKVTGVATLNLLSGFIAIDIDKNIPANIDVAERASVVLPIDSYAIVTGKGNVNYSDALLDDYAIIKARNSIRLAKWDLTELSIVAAQTYVNGIISADTELIGVTATVTELTSMYVSIMISKGFGSTQNLIINLNSKVDDIFILLMGNETENLDVGDTFIDSGAIAIKITGEILTDKIVRTITDDNGNIVNSIDTSKAGIYKVSYEVDGFSKSRTVVVSQIDDQAKIKKIILNISKTSINVYNQQGKNIIDLLEEFFSFRYKGTQISLISVDTNNGALSSDGILQDVKSATDKVTIKVSCGVESDITQVTINVLRSIKTPDANDINISTPETGIAAGQIIVTTDSCYEYIIIGYRPEGYIVKQNWTTGIGAPQVTIASPTLLSGDMLILRGKETETEAPSIEYIYLISSSDIGL